MKKRILLAFTTIVVIFTLIECQKGDIGPSGNANVKSYTYSVTSSQWTSDPAAKEWSTDYTLPALADVSGGVFLYSQDSISWSALPHVDYGVAFSFKFDPTKKTIEVVASDAKAATLVPNPGPMTFKVVTIPESK
jgi:hypothetical protein